uniref:Serine protease inhibitor n=1 Tax=Clonorchis sinensis TaxID=79923 RepID=A6YID8_CLOSI|nr:serine protease inhibitor [Clonorchis sinensis]
MANQLEIYTSVGQFASDFYAQVIEQQAGNPINTFLSPLSIYFACLITMAGVAQSTLQQMRTVLHIPAHFANNDVPKNFGSELTEPFLNSTGVDFLLANRLYILQPTPISNSFKTTIKRFYKTDTKSLNQSLSLKGQLRKINRWVSSQTTGKIPELIPDNVLTADSVLALINALYFRGLWKYPFDKTKTKEEDFHCLDGTVKKVPMMNILGHYPTLQLEDINAEAIKLPFTHSLYDMLIILPYWTSGLPAVLNKLKQPGKLHSILQKKFRDTKVIVRLPRFKLAKLPTTDVKNLLKACGLTALFDSAEADLSQMTDQPGVTISNMLHKAVIEVDEEGVTAAAATGMIASTRTRTPEFDVNHPFFLAVIYKSTLPVFMGHVVEPEQN